MPKIRIARSGLLWWLLKGGPLEGLFWWLQAVLALIGAGQIISGETLSGIAFIVLLPATLLLCVPLWLLWLRVVRPVGARVLSSMFEVVD